MPTLWTIHFNSPCNFTNAEFIFEFEGEKYRFIRGTEEESDKLLTIVDDDSNEGSDKCFEKTLRLLDYLSWDLHGGIQYLGRTGHGFKSGTIKLENAVVPSFRARNIRSYIADSFHSIPDVTDDDQRFALKLWNEAQSSHSPFFSFINYWSIVELPRVRGVNHKSRAINWINGLSSNKISGLSELRKNLKSKYNFSSDVGNFLYSEGRNAIAHVTRDPTLRRYDRESYEKISDLTPAMRAIAKYYIINELNLGHYSNELKVLKTKKRTNALAFLKENQKRGKETRKRTERLLRNRFKMT
ncbi:hypothetical protein MYX76_12790 [Desulfobacterota bacterium AH_259_B03_O07]|nr:hypothetical protein [Desulfobacterota bacterium AH_259_B03_O07]